MERLAEDHRNARQLAELIVGIPGLSVRLETVETNLVFFDVDLALGYASQLSARSIVAACEFTIPMPSDCVPAPI